MEPIVNAEIYKLLNNPEEARRLLAAFYQEMGYHVVGMPDVKPAAVGEKKLVMVKR